jgi:hypothetical protein
LDLQRLALKFLRKLDQIRHGSMIVRLMNGRSAGGAFPETVDAAYYIAYDWKSTSARVSNSRGIISCGDAFLLADDERALVIALAASVGPRKSEAKIPTRCNASSVNHERVRFTSPPTARAASPAEVVPRAKRPEVRTCYERNTEGHIHRDFPRRVLVTGDDEAGED